MAKVRTGVVLVVSAAIVVAACSSGQEETAVVDTSAPDESVSSTTTLAEQDTRSDADEVSGDDLEVTAEVVDPAAETRCALLGYACGWDDAPAGSMAASFDLLDEVRAIMVDAGDPQQAVEAAAAALRTHDDVVEVLPDLVGYTGVMFRLDGAPPVILDTELAGPIGDDEVDRDRAVLPAEVVDAAARPTGMRAVPPERYHPVGGPLEGRTALIIDPYATIDEECSSVSWEGLESILDWESPVAFRECRQTGDGLSEGSAVAAIFRSRPDDYTTVTHLRDSAATPMAVATELASADAVHLVTHGSANCSGDLEDSLQPPNYDPSRCYSMTALGPLSSADKQALRDGNLTAPPGASFSNSRWWATGDFMARAVSRDTIVFGSHCTAGNGGLARAGLAGFAGWHGYARVISAVDAAIRFWGLMLVDGLEFDLAYTTLQNEKLHRSIFTNGPEYLGRRATATLVAGGTNPRARDVIELQYDGAPLADGATVEITGTPGDNQNDRVENVGFKVEGVQDGTQDATVIELYVDGQLVTPRFTVGEGQPLESLEPGDGWTDWLVSPDSIELPFDVQLSDLDPDVRPGFVWEARVYERSNRYSADEVDPVYLAARLTATGELAFFEELGRQLAPTGTELTENLLTIEFPSDGGEVQGTYLATIEAPNQMGGGGWTASIDGQFDPASGSLTGNVDAAAGGGAAGIYAGDLASGSFSGSFDWGSGTMTGTMLDGAQQLPFTARVG